jgi:hypothetical protein
MEGVMEEKLVQLDHYLENTQVLFQAIEDNDLDQMNQCLKKNREIMKWYDQTELIDDGSSQSRKMLEKIERIAEINQKCFQRTEERCRDLSKEIGNTNRNRSGIQKYGAKQTPIPRFIDHKI